LKKPQPAISSKIDVSDVNLSCYHILYDDESGIEEKIVIVIDVEKHIPVLYK
jgi:hypothetical protein